MTRLARKGDWTETTLGQIAGLVIGKTPPRNEKKYWTDELTNPFCTIADMEGKWVHPKREGVTNTAIQNAKARKVAAGSLMMSFKLTIGRVGFAGVDLYPNEAIVAIDVDNRISTKEFLYLILGSQDLTHGSGRAIKGATLNSASLAAIPLVLPALSEQKRIIDVMGSVDAYIAALQQQADDARTARNAVLHELMTAGGDGWAEVSLMKLLSQSVGGVWGSEPDTDQEEVTVVRSTEFSKSGILRYQTGVVRSIKSSQLSTRELSAGDILLEKSGGGPDQPVGRVVYVSADIPPRFVCSNFIQLLRPKTSEVHPKFLFLVMWMWHMQNRTLEYQAQTTGIRNLRTPDYLEQTVKLPSQADQYRVVETVSAMDDVLNSTEQAIGHAKKLRSSLLSGLLSGEHEIPESYDRLIGAA